VVTAPFGTCIEHPAGDRPDLHHKVNLGPPRWQYLSVWRDADLPQVKILTIHNEVFGTSNKYNELASGAQALRLQRPATLWVPLADAGANDPTTSNNEQERSSKGGKTVPSNYPVAKVRELSAEPSFAQPASTVSPLRGAGATKPCPG
jgi:hypothetical protein